MLQRLTARNFKRFEELDIPLGNPVVLVGPNNSGKTSALQAVALWSLGVRRWMQKRREKAQPSERTGVAINRKDFLEAPVPSAPLLWRRLKTQHTARENGHKSNKKVPIEITIHGQESLSATKATEWRCGMSFDIANDESFYCRPSGTNEGSEQVPEQAANVRVAFLHPMSGLSLHETLLPEGAVNVRLGEGRTAEVLRNLCYTIAGQQPERWGELQNTIEAHFRMRLNAPVYLAERGELEMSYRDHEGITLDLMAAGRGVQQILLLSAYLITHPGCVLLLDEPDAHLEILRQRDIYQMLVAQAERHSSQLIIASHSEVILDQAARSDGHSVVAFVGRPHVIPGNRRDKVRAALSEVAASDYLLAIQNGWVLYLEDETDLSILRAFARKLGHPASEHLAQPLPFLVKVGNQPNRGRSHFAALSEAKPDLLGYLLVDHDAPDLEARATLREKKWSRREIENYLCQPETLLNWASSYGRGETVGELFADDDSLRAREIMDLCIRRHCTPAALEDRGDEWWSTMKASDSFLDRIFGDFFRLLDRPLRFRKSDYHQLVQYIPEGLIDTEVISVLDSIHGVASKAVSGE